MEERSYPVTDRLSQFTSSQFQSIGRVRSNLFQVEANQGYWNSVFGYHKPEKYKVWVSNCKSGKALNKIYFLCYHFETNFVKDTWTESVGRRLGS